MTEYKIAILGDGGVGKSSITIQLVQNHVKSFRTIVLILQFVEEYDPTIEDSYRKQVTIDDETCILDVLDTGGREEFSRMKERYTTEGSCFYVVYSITSRSSFNYVNAERESVIRHKGTDKINMVLVGMERM